MDRETCKSLQTQFGPSPSGRMIVIDVKQQRLDLYEQDKCLQSWPISTSSRGCGNEKDSLKTPLGAHRIAKKIGADKPANTIFKAREDTGCTATIIHQARSSGEDQITSRILWLKGIETGKNLDGDVDTQLRYIYIHGTPEEGLIGQPVSHGCIRMRNDDVITLFDQIEAETLVYIKDN